jgi:hypothetical protein
MGKCFEGKAVIKYYLIRKRHRISALGSGETALAN